MATEKTDIAGILEAAQRTVLDHSPESIENLRKALLGFDSSAICIFCGLYRADLLCDFIIGFKMEMYEGRRVFSPDIEMFTCDMPICEKCRVQGDPLFICGKRGAIEIPDFCPIHHMGQIHGENPCITAEEAIGWRNTAQLLVRERKLHLLKGAEFVRTERGRR